jgi:hypothetical protein
VGDYYTAELTARPWPYEGVDSEDIPAGLREALAAEVEYVGDGEVRVQDAIKGEGRELYILCPQSNGGVYHYTDDSELPGALRDVGIGYDIRDEGYYEFPGEEIRWRPEVGDLQGRSVLSGGEIALGTADYSVMCEAATGAGDDADAELGRQVRAYFDDEVPAEAQIDGPFAADG